MRNRNQRPAQIEFLELLDPEKILKLKRTER